MARLFGEKLVLREFRKEDLPHIREWATDDEVVRFLSDIFLYPHSLNQTEGFLNYVLEGKSDVEKMFVVAQKDTLDYIGQVGLHHIDWKNRIAVVGIVIGKKDLFGKGIGSEAMELLQYFAFNKLNLNKLELSVHDFNERGIKCYKKCGFVEEGRLRQKYFYNGRYIDSISMGILKEEYDKGQSNIREIIFQSNKAK